MRNAMKLFKSKRERFYENLVNEMGLKLSKYAEYKVSDKNAVENIALDTLETAWIKIDELMKSENPKGWLYNALKIHIKRYYKELQISGENLQTVEISELDMPVEAIFDDEADFEDKLSSDELHIAHLKEQGYKHNEIAQIMGLQTGTISSKVSRIKAKLTKYLEGEKV
jgi:RNA polymerase sigma factor (sigma-70 family)